jgi:hypothetical protein
MTKLQAYALQNPLARADDTGVDSQAFRWVSLPWSLILTVNK